MIKDTYCRMIDRVQADERLVQRALHAARPQRRTPAMRRVAMTALLLCLMLGTSALAAQVPVFNSWLYHIAPDIALFFRPVNVSDEDQGIRMAVEAIRIDGNTAEIYVTMTDVIADRLDSTIDLFDSYWLDTPGSASAGCSLAYYNEAERQATFHISYRSEMPIRQDKLTFGLSRLLTKKQATTGIVPGFDWAMAASKPETLQPGARIRGAGYTSAAADQLLGGAFDPETHHALFDNAVLLAPQGVLAEPAKGVQLTGAGWVDGMLHIQLHYDDILRTDNHGFVRLRAPDGAELSDRYNIAFWDDEKTGSYEDYVFEISPEEAAQHTLIGDFITCECLVTGNWSVTFTLEETASP